MEILRTEFYRQGGFRRILKFILVSVILGILWSYFIVGQQREGFMMTGCYDDYKGLDAIGIAADDRREYSGKMDNEVFKLAGEAYKRGLNKEGQLDMSDDLLKFTSYADKLATQDYMFKKYSGKDIYSLELEEDFGQDFYGKEEVIYDLYIDRKWPRKEENKLAREIYSKRELPYEYYDGYGVWMNGIEHVQILGFVLMLLAVFFSSGVISRDVESGLDEIISTTKNGRKTLYISKTVISIVSTFLIYIVGILIYIGILRYLLPNQGLKTSSQVLNYGILNQRLVDILREGVFFGIISSLVIGSFLVFISSITKKEKNSLILGVLIVLLNFIMAFYIANNGNLSEFFINLIPGSTLFLYHIINPIITIFNRAILTSDLSIAMAGILILVFLILGKIKYERR